MAKSECEPRSDQWSTPSTWSARASASVLSFLPPLAFTFFLDTSKHPPFQGDSFSRRKWREENSDAADTPPQLQASEPRGACGKKSATGYRSLPSEWELMQEAGAAWWELPAKGRGSWLGRNVPDSLLCKGVAHAQSWQTQGRRVTRSPRCHEALRPLLFQTQLSSSSQVICVLLRQFFLFVPLRFYFWSGIIAFFLITT